MQRYFKSRQSIEQFLQRLHMRTCPSCGAQGTLVRHGFIRGAVSPTEYGIRAWRIFCDPDSPQGAGCGRAPSICLSSTLLRRCFTADQLLTFILALCAGQSVRAAWKHSDIGLSLRTGYRLHKHLRLRQTILRTHLCARAPPSEKKSASSTLLQVLDHLQETFGGTCTVTIYQETLQRDFLSRA